MKFIKYIFSLFIIIFGINNVFATNVDVVFITKDIENPQERLCAFINDIVSSVNCVNYDDFDSTNEKFFRGKLVIFVFDANNCNEKIQDNKLYSILKLRQTMSIRVASFGHDDLMTLYFANRKHKYKYTSNLSEDIQDIRKYIKKYKKKYGKKDNIDFSSISGSTETTENSTEFSPEGMPEGSKIDQKNYKRSFFTPTKTALAGAGVEPFTKSKKIKKSNINISTLNFNKTVDEKTTNPSSENVKQNKKSIDSKSQEEAQIYIGTPKTELQNDNEVIERYQQEQNIKTSENNGMILPSNKKEENKTDISKENKTDETKSLIAQKEKPIKKKSCCIIA